MSDILIDELYPYSMTSFEHAVESVILSASPRERIALDELLILGERQRPLYLTKWLVANADTDVAKTMLVVMKEFNRFRQIALDNLETNKKEEA